MNIIEFTIACKLISLKLRGLELPKVIPSNLWNSVQALSNFFFMLAINLIVICILFVLLDAVPKASSTLLTSPPTMAPGIAPPMTLPLSTVSPSTVLPAVSPPIVPSVSPCSLENSTTSPTVGQPVLNQPSPVQIAGLVGSAAVNGQVGPPPKPAPPAAPSRKFYTIVLF